MSLCSSRTCAGLTGRSHRGPPWFRVRRVTTRPVFSTRFSQQGHAYALASENGPVPTNSAGDGADPPPAAKRPPPKPKKPSELPARWHLIQKDIDEDGVVVVAHVAPATRVVICEALGYGVGQNMEKQLVAGLRALGFDYVFDTLFTADLTIVEEGTELIRRIHDKLTGSAESAEHPMPMFTSCCPGWIQLLEKSYPELIPHVSTCKSPQMMMGAVVKSFFAQQLRLPPERVKVVSVMPCVRKQPEADRDVAEFQSAAAFYASRQSGDGGGTLSHRSGQDSGKPPAFCALDPDHAEEPPTPWACQIEPQPDSLTDIGRVRDVDHVLTTLDVATVFQLKGIELRDLEPSEFDSVLGSGSGAGQVFGTTGGVMEAALRTAYELISGERLERVVFEEVRGLDAVKVATVEVTPSEAGPLGSAARAAGIHGAIPLKVAVVNGLGQAKKVATAVRDGTMDVDFVEIMACPGGCIGGGGNPRALTEDVLKQRQQAIYTADERKTVRRSHENPLVQALYAKFLGEPNGHIAHELLHTHYVPGGAPSIDGKGGE